MLPIPAALASLRPYSRKASQQSTASTDPVGPTRRESLMAVSPKPQPASTTLSPGLTGSVGKIASLWSVSPSTRICFQRTNFGTRTLFQKSMYWLCARCSGATASTVIIPSRRQASLVFGAIGPQSALGVLLRAHDLDADKRLVAFDPCIVPGRDGVGIAGGNRLLRAVIHFHRQPAGHGVSDVAHLA